MPCSIATVDGGDLPESKIDVDEPMFAPAGAPHASSVDMGGVVSNFVLHGFSRTDYWSSSSCDQEEETLEPDIC